MKKYFYILILILFIFSCSSLQITEDKLEGTRDITYCNYFYAFGLKLKIRDIGDKQLFLLDIGTVGMRDWLFIKSAEIYDSDTYDKNKRISFVLDNVERNTSSSGYTGVSVLESSTILLSLSDLEKLYKILKTSKKVTIRFNGKNYYDDQDLQNFQKDSVIKTIEYYYENIAKKPLPL